MVSLIAHYKQFGALLIVSLFLLGCVVPASLGSKVYIRRQNEQSNYLSKHSTAKKMEEPKLGCVPLLLVPADCTPRNGTRVLSITNAAFNN